MQEEDKELSTSKERTNKLDLNSIATIGAVILSIVAISISVLEVTTMRTQQKSAVWPYLQINSSYTDGKYQILLENKGVGPALIKNLALFVDDEPAYEFDKIISDLVGLENAFSYDVYQVSNPANSVISSREKVRMFSVPLRNNDKENTEFTPGVIFAQQANQRFNIAICYCSIHEDCWKTDIRMSGVEEVKACN